MKLLQGLILVVLLTGCEYFTPGDAIGRKVVAQVGSEILYLQDLQQTIPTNLAQADSIKLADKIVKDWVKRHLMIDKAFEEFAVDEETIEAKVSEYRDALIVHEFQKLYVNSHLNTEVDTSEINTYYDNNKDNFVLKQNIVRCLYAKVPKSSPDINQLRRNLRAYPGSNKEDIESYCLQYALNFFLDDSLWINFEELVAATPLNQVEDKIRWLNNTEFSETRDDNFIYMVRILDYKISNELSPMEFIQDDIENIIINKRKLELKRELEATIYDEATKNEGYQIFSN